MKKRMTLLALAFSALLCSFSACKSNKTSPQVSPQTIAQVIDTLCQRHPSVAPDRIETGVNQAAALWFCDKDGDEKVFADLCSRYFVGDELELEKLFQNLSKNLELLFGYFNKMNVDLKLPLHLNVGNISALDEIFGGYDPGAHLYEDLYLNQVAFITLLNFKTYSLAEKNELGKQWSRQQWAYARMGDAFTSRIPSDLLQKYSEISTRADNYISDYNICMDKLRTADSRQLFPDDLRLITHWGLRDELKSQYANADGLERQQMIYSVMKRIIDQSIPQNVINNPKVLWNPLSNEVLQDGKALETSAEACLRYEQMLNVFHILQKMDAYQPEYKNYIEVVFNGQMEMAQADVEKLFTDLISSPAVKEVAALIQKDLGRELEPFDLWYNGFADRGSFPEAELNRKTQGRYPDVAAVQKDLPEILKKLGFSAAEALEICSHIQVDASRGAGHAWEAAMKGDKARLRTRVGAQGMDYKGYNIAVHEFGHNVEQVLSLYQVDHYMLRGVPNTSFTEALAFMFQKRDMSLLGFPQNNPLADHRMALDIFWGCYEIMGVALVDMKVWEWLYAHPDATKESLKEAVLTISTEMWNQYYAPIFGKKDETILAIYSHMISSPLYLNAYPIGHLIDFQLEKFMKGKSFAQEVKRIFTLGSLTPEVWMQQAVGEKLSVQPLIQAASEAVAQIQK